MTEYNGKTFGFTSEQLSRLRDLGAKAETLEAQFSGPLMRDANYRQTEQALVTAARSAIKEMLSTGGRPLVEVISETLCELLVSRGLIQVSTPIIMSRARLSRMVLESDPLFYSQVFWLDAKRCLRPMLAPHLYEYMLDLLKLAEGRPFGIFEVGPCFRKESKGSRHASEFTMLNLVEVGLPLDKRLDRLSELVEAILGRLGLKDWRHEEVGSTVYEKTIDIVSCEGLELASCSMGPHPLDEAWGFDGTWLGLGFGLERLAMAAANLDRVSLVSRTLGRIKGIPLKI